MATSIPDRRLRLRAPLAAGDERGLAGAGDIVGTFTRHVIDDDSGAGTEFAIADVDEDGRPDVVTANEKRLFLFRRAP